MRFKRRRGSFKRRSTRSRRKRGFRIKRYGSSRGGIRL